MASGTIDYSQPESAVLFGDAAAAAVLGRSPGESTSEILLSRFNTFSDDVGLAQIRGGGGGTLHHPNFETTTADMNLFQMRGPEIFKSATRHMQTFLDDFFDSIPWSREEVDRVIPHQASRMATRQLTKRYGFRPDQVSENIAPPRKLHCRIPSPDVERSRSSRTREARSSAAARWNWSGV